MEINIPELSLVVLIGPSGAGKSTFARKHFLSTEVLSSDYCRSLVADDENDQTVTQEAFEILRYIASKRLAAGRLIVVDATSVKSEDRKPLIDLARSYHCLPVAIVFDIPGKICQQRNDIRPDRNFGGEVIRFQQSAMRRSMRYLRKDGFRQVFKLKSVEEIDAVNIVREPLWNNKKHEKGPFDIIGDIHGCFEELSELLSKLGYQVQEADRADGLNWQVSHPEGRKPVFLGDLVDRGPNSPEVLRLVMSTLRDGTGICVPGNHDVKLMRKLRGKNVQLRHGLAETVEQFEKEPPEFHLQVAEFIDSLVSHYVLNDGKLVVAHAGMKQEMQGRGSGKVREFALYGETTGETDEFGLPVRFDWASEYRGSACVVYGHTPIPYPEWMNNTVNIDTGCVFGGALTALRYPEREFVQVKARKEYAESKKPLQPANEQASGQTAQQLLDDVLDISDLLGKRIISTRLRRSVIIGEEHGAAAIEVMSRFAANPKWLIYLPPTMSPCETSQEEGFLEYPTEAFSYFLSEGVPSVICEKKHMGSRAVVIVCRDEAATLRRFGIEDDGIGIVYTRTGRRFFTAEDHEKELLARLRNAIDASGFWDQLNTDWVCLDCELMPWSAKAQGLLKDQYASVGTSAGAAIAATTLQLNEARGDGRDVLPMYEKFQQRAELIKLYEESYKQYCWPVNSITDYKLAPFHILATEGKTHADRDHVWHMETIKKICECDEEILLATPYKIVDVTDTKNVEDGCNWWLQLTETGAEGMVVKPCDFVAQGSRGMVQPAVKCRGREYLRIIYGPEYTLPEHITRLRKRSLSRKRKLAINEFSLGIESLERFVRNEPLRRVHECVFGVMALESTPVDPRL